MMGGSHPGDIQNVGGSEIFKIMEVIVDPIRNPDDAGGASQVSCMELSAFAVFIAASPTHDAVQFLTVGAEQKANFVPEDNLWGPRGGGGARWGTPVMMGARGGVEGPGRTGHGKSRGRTPLEDFMDYLMNHETYAEGIKDVEEQIQTRIGVEDCFVGLGL